MMANNPDAYLEKEFQYQAADILQKLGYTLLSPEECRRERGGRYNVLLKDILRSKLRELNMFEYGGAKYRFNAVQYVVMHEFVHFMHSNHSNKFYEMLSTLMPDWKTRKKLLETVAFHVSE